jgi:hypothetical protein
MINQDQVVYESRIYQNENIYNNDIGNPNIYLTRFLNILLRATVDAKYNYANKVIGCDPFFVDIVSNKIKFVVSPGRIIIDSTLLNFPSATFLDLTLNSSYKSIVILAGYKYLLNNNKASLQICFLDETNNVLHTDGQDLITQGLDVVVLGKFELQYFNGHLVNIYHPYGLFRKQHYSQFLINKVSSSAIAVTNEIFTLLNSKASLYDPFLVNGIQYKIGLPLYLDYYWDGIERFFNDKLRARYRVCDIFDFYYNRFDHNIQHRTEAFDDIYNYTV